MAAVKRPRQDGAGSALGEQRCGKRRLPGTDSLLTPCVGYNADSSPKAIFINKVSKSSLSPSPAPEEALHKTPGDESCCPFVLFCFQMEEPRSAISYAVRVEVTGKTRQQILWHWPPHQREQYVLGVKVGGFIYMNPQSSLLSYPSTPCHFCTLLKRQRK